MKNIIIGVVVVAAALGALAFFNLTPFRTIVQNVVTGSPTGSTFSSNSPDNGVIMAPVTGATTSSITNNSGSDLMITQVNVACEGVGTSKTAVSGSGLAALTLTIATSSTAVTTVTSGTAVGIITVATSSPVFVLASSSPSTATSSTALIWAAGTLLNFGFNATNTASCHAGVSTVSL